MSTKKQLEEMVEYVDFPMGVYVYETGKVIAANRAAKRALNGSACQNANLLWANHKKLKFSPSLLKGGSKVFYQMEVLVEQDVKLMDVEMNVLPFSSEHIVVAFFEESYKQFFRRERYPLLPGLIWKSGEGEYVTVNGAAKKGLGLFVEAKEKTEQISQTERERVEKIKAVEQKILDTKEPMFCQVEQTDFEDRGNRFLKVNRIPILGKKDVYLGILIVFKPILSEDDFGQLFSDVLYENALLRQWAVGEKRTFLRIETGEEMIIRDATTNIESFGYSIEKIYKESMAWKDLIHPEDRERVSAELLEGLEKKERFIKQKYRLLLEEDNVVWVDAVTSGTETRPGILSMVVSRVRDSSLPDRTEYQVKKETYLDFLTGLPNRLKYEEDAEQWIETAITTKKKGYVIVLDLDDFKHINEAFGPEYGDVLLKKIAKTLNDMPEIENYCYRVDGDEFLLFVRSEYAKKLEQIIQSSIGLFQNSWQLEDKECFCSVSIGIAEYPKDSIKPRDLLKYADAAVYEAKRKGKNRIQYYKKAVLNSSIERVNYEKYLRKAIAKGCVEFKIFFQPIVRTDTKQVVGAEALVRWYSPELGFITPINFISLSEYLGLIVPLGEYVLQQSFLVCKRWNETYPDFSVSVNLSVVQLVQPNIVERILEIARATGVNSRNIILEVTESLAIEDMGLMKSVLLELKNHGFRIALDDFGTGYSSLNHMMEMPLAFVKIDKSFVAQYGTEEFNPSLLSAITELAHSVHTQVIVEGVETRQQMEFLMFLNTDRLQGYLYGKPMPEEEFEKKCFPIKQMEE